MSNVKEDKILLAENERVAYKIFKIIGVKAASKDPNQS